MRAAALVYGLHPKAKIGMKYEAIEEVSNKENMVQLADQFWLVSISFSGALFVIGFRGWNERMLLLSKYVWSLEKFIF